MAPAGDDKRTQTPAAVDQQKFDAVIIGGGISGASAAQHLTAAGYTVLLVEKDDFAAAASSRSSRLLHSGLRYLAPPNSLWDFVRNPKSFLAGVITARQSSRVGDEMVSTLAHRVHKTRLLLPIFQSSSYRGWQVDLGVLFLTLIGRRKTALNYRRASAEQARTLPFIQWLPQGADLQSVAGMDDHQFHWPERICIDCVLDAERMGAVVMNYTKAEAIEQTEDGWQVAIRDRDGQTARPRGRMLLNFTGVWIDQMNALIPATNPAGAPPARQIVGVKGVSIAVQLPASFEGVGIAGKNSEGDAIMCVPWGKLHYIGPTETVYDGDIEDVKPEDADIDHLIEEINRFLPGMAMDRSKILHAWAGVRPVSYDPDRAKGRRMPFSVIHDLGAQGFANVLTISWAAFMMYRPTARRVLAAVRRRIRPSRPLQQVPARDAAATTAESPPLIASRPEVTHADILRCVEQEHARDLVGILFRRTGLGWYVGIPEHSVREAATLVAPHLGWDAADIDREVADYMAYTRKYHWINHTDWAA